MKKSTQTALLLVTSASVVTRSYERNKGHRYKRSQGCYERGALLALLVAGSKKPPVTRVNVHFGVRGLSAQQTRLVPPRELVLRPSPHGSRETRRFTRAAWGGSWRWTVTSCWGHWAPWRPWQEKMGMTRE